MRVVLSSLPCSPAAMDIGINWGSLTISSHRGGPKSRNTNSGSNHSRSSNSSSIGLNGRGGN